MEDNKVIYGINLLVEFDSIIDTDLGLLYLMKNEYNKAYIRDELLNSNDEYFFKCELLTRETVNPLTVILKKEYLDNANDLYFEILEKDYSKVLIYSKPNSMFTMVYNYVKLQSNIIDTTILCKNEEEKQLIRSLLNNVRIIIGDREKINLQPYDTMFVKDYYNTLKYKNLKEKNIYILRYNFNLESAFKKEDIPLMTVSSQVGDINKILIATPYADFVIPRDEISDEQILKEEMKS